MNIEAYLLILEFDDGTTKPLFVHTEERASEMYNESVGLYKNVTLVKLNSEVLYTTKTHIKGEN